MLERLKYYLNLEIVDQSKNTLLNLLIADATNYLKEYCGIEFDTLPTKFESVVAKMAAEDYIRRGQQGITSQSFSGVSESTTDGYSLEVMKVLNKNRKIKFL